MSARYVSSQLIKNVSNGSKTVAAEFVDKTTAWVRPSAYPSTQLKNTFADVVQQNVGTFSPQTARVAMKESEHQSDMDQRMHYTVYEIDNNGNVIKVRHIVQQVQK